MDLTTSMDLLTPATESRNRVPLRILQHILRRYNNYSSFRSPFPDERYHSQIVAKWNIFEKADEPGWAAIVPFYGNYIFHYITWGNGWWFLTSFIPGISLVVKVITMVKLSCSFGKNSVFTLGLMLYPPIFLAILGFDDSEYID